MKKITLLIIFSFVTTLFLQGQLIINHLNRDITTLTESEINFAKSVLHIAYGHTSHGSQVTTGMLSLVGFANDGGKGLSFPDNIFAWNNGGTGGALDLHDYAMGGDVGYYPQWYNNTVTYLNNPANSDVNVIMWSWCGQVSSRTEQSMIDTYLNPMTSLETTYPNVKFVYMTGHLDGTGETGNLNLRDQQIRDYCTINNKILYDFEDIESYDPDGLVNYMKLYANDNCDYDSSGFSRNWATRWQNTHEEGVDWYSCSCAHSQSLNGNQKAYAAWHLFVEIAKLIALDEIPAKFTVSDTIVGDSESACFDATDTLTVTGDTDDVEFQDGSFVDLIAGKSIFLLPGFHACEGSTTHAFITTENQYCFSSVSSPAPTYKSAYVSPDLLNSKKQESAGMVKVYPNPSSGRVTVEWPNFENATTITVSNSIGTAIYRRVIHNSNRADIELYPFPKGLYFISVANNETTQISKIILR